MFQRWIGYKYIRQKFKCCVCVCVCLRVCVCYLAGGKSSSTVDVSVKVEGGFWYTAAAETETCSGLDEELCSPQLTFHYWQRQELRLNPDTHTHTHTYLTHRWGGESWIKDAVNEWLTNTCRQIVCFIHVHTRLHNSLIRYREAMPGVLTEHGSQQSRCTLCVFEWQ